MATTPGNATNDITTGISGFTGTAFTATPVTQYDIIVGGATSSTLANVGPGSAGQVLQSGGNAANPAYSTATYPSTAGTSGNVLTSDGTNWSSSAPQVFSLKGQLTSQQIKALHATPIQIVAAPGANKSINIINATISYVYGGTSAFTAAGGQVVNMYFNNVTNVVAVLTNANLVGTASGFSVNAGFVVTFTTTSSYTNVPLNFFNPIVTEISGNAANDNVVNWSLTYSIVNT